MDPLPPTLDLRSSLILNRGEPSRACWIVEQGAVCPDLLASLLTLATPPTPTLTRRGMLSPSVS